MLEDKQLAVTRFYLNAARRKHKAAKDEGGREGWARVVAKYEEKIRETERQKARVVWIN